MDKAKIQTLKSELCELLAKHGIDKFEIMFDHAGEAYGIRNIYTDAESILNLEARKHLLVNRLISEGK